MCNFIHCMSRLLQPNKSVLILLNKMSTKKYKYTKDNVYLTDEQRDFYEENGYIVFRNLVDFDLLDECKNRFLEYCDGKVNTVHMTIMRDMSLKHTDAKGEFLINKIQDFNYDDALFKYVAFKPMVDIVQSIIGSNITSAHTMLINKPPNSKEDTSRHPLHQDLHYFPFRPAELIVASWTAMEKVDEKNGCLFLVPGSHKGTLLKHEYPPNVTNVAYHGVLGLEHLPTVNLPMEKGDTVFFHPLVLHGSGPNLTKGFRKAISAHYANTNCYFVNVTGTLQDNVEKEILKMAKSKGYPNVTFDMIWKVKSRIVRGEPGKFQNFDSQL
ncbi:hypothetical protein RI129_010044 [Pyrocoelia pectoralis]|uniref:phytanoyl-CoA dioxygenase n=1 Tax=Pyrocoelia pectoralis TaxID=417401 RepID=A0AAN7ZGG9_9COLE